MPERELDAASAARVEVFDVSEHGALTLRGARTPTTWREALDLAAEGPADLGELINLAEDHPPLASFLAGLAVPHCVDGVDKLEVALDFFEYHDPHEPNVEREALQNRLEAVRELSIRLDERHDGWVVWLQQLHTVPLNEILHEANRWLDAPPDVEKLREASYAVGPQAEALRLFEEFDEDMLDTVSVDLVYCDHPGSSCNAAELRIDVEDANACARALGVTVRFVRARSQPTWEVRA